MSIDRGIITGWDAIELARETSTQLYMYECPVEDGGPITIEHAEVVAREDPSLVYCYTG